MYGTTWKTSARKYGVLVQSDVRIPMRDGIELSAEIFRPDTTESCPAILSIHCYSQAAQLGPIRPNSFSSFVHLHPNEERGRGSLEAGDPQFYVRRGYVHVVANVRGTGKSGGTYNWLGPQEVQDACEVIEWMAKQDWCTGKVGMFGVSYFAIIQFMVAGMNPPSLACIFAPWGLTDYYRHSYYHGGILRHQRAIAFPHELSNARLESVTAGELGKLKFKAAVDSMLGHEDIAAVPKLVEILKNAEHGASAFTADILLHPLDGPFWKERTPNLDNITVPAYLGGCWGNYGLHLPGAFQAWEAIKAPKKMLIGPPIYLDRPVYQMQYESLRWFDHWLKGVDTGIMDEPPVRVFVEGTGRWRTAPDWPLPDTRWTPFYLHEGGLLSEHEYWPNESSQSFDDSPWHRGSIEYASPQLVEETEVIGPIALNLYACTTDTEMFWNVFLEEIDRDGNRKLLTRGWLKGSHRELDAARSKPWAPYHSHKSEEPLVPGKVYEFNIEIIPTANLFKAGSRIALRISGVDHAPKHAIEALSGGHLKRQSASRITVFHDADHPSHLLLPITMGNLIGTYISGGRPYVNA